MAIDRNDTLNKAHKQKDDLYIVDRYKYDEHKNMVMTRWKEQYD